MKKYILLFTVCAFTAIAYGSINLNNLISGINQKEVSVLSDTIHVPYLVIEGGRSEKIDSSKIDFSKQFVIKVMGEVPSTAARLKVNSLILTNKIITLTYKLVHAGKALGVQNQFYYYLVIDKKYQGEIKMVEL